MGDENSIANETFAHAVGVFESAWAWCVKNDARFDNGIIHDIVGRMIDAHEREVYKMPDNNYNEPITTELREILARIDTYNKTNIAELVEDKLKAIDSIHANLESEYVEMDKCAKHPVESREIDDLKAALKTQRNNFEQATSAREHWKKLYEASQDECKRLAESVKQLERERDEEHDEVNWLYAELKGLEERSIELPKDADGEPIHVGDVMVYADGNTCPLPVVALVPPAVFLTDDGPRYANMCRHHTPDTWERIIKDAMAYAELPTDMDVQLLIARCEALAGN